MADLIERFRSLDQIDSPDLWRDAEHRTPRSATPPQKPGQRILTVVVAFAVAAAAIAFAVQALGGGAASRPTDQPAPIAIGSHANGSIYIQSGGGDGGATVESVDFESGHRQTVFGRNDYHAEISWSPDGTRIAYVGLVDTGTDHQAYGIFTSSPDGSQATQLTSGPLDTWPSWSPDGTRIVFSKASDSSVRNLLCTSLSGVSGCPTDIFMMNADGTGVQQITHDPAPEFNPEFSPDGTKIAFVRKVSSTEEIDAVNTDGTRLMAIAQGTGGNQSRFSWSPDGQRVVFVRVSDTGWGLHVVNADGTQERLLFDPRNTVNEGPVWSPDGNWIAFSSTVDAHPGCGRDSDVCSDLLMIHPDGNDILRTFTRDQSGVSDIAWQPLPVSALPSSTSSPPAGTQVKARLARTIPLGRPSSLSSIAYGDGSAWVALREGDSFNQYSIVRLDGGTGQEIAKIPVDTVPDWEVGGGGLVFANGSIWVAGRTYDRETQRDGGEIIQIDPQTNTVVHTITLPAPVADLAVDANGLWVLTSQGRTPTLERIDPVNGDVAASISLEGDVGRSVVSVDGTIFALVRTGAPTYGDIVYQVNPATSAVSERYTTKLSYNAVAETGGWMWMALGDGLFWIDPAAGQGRAVPDVSNTGDVVAAGDGGVWVLGPKDGRAPSRYDIASGTLGPPVDTGRHAPVAMAVATGALWAANDDGTVTLIELSA
jgi:Tol biopolymer transport system component